MFDGTGIELTDESEAALIACAGLFDDERETPEDYAERMRGWVERGLPFVCANPDIAVDPAPKATINYLGLNQKVPELANPKVWEALRWAVDYQGMTDSFLKGRFMVNQSFWPAGFFASLEENPYHLDIAKAKALLAEAGYPNGFTIDFDAPLSFDFGVSPRTALRAAPAAFC